MRPTAPHDSSKDRRSRRLETAVRPWWQSLGPGVLFVLVVALYAPSTDSDFIYDDYKLIVEEDRPRSVRDIARVFTERHWPNLPYYRPVPRSSMQVQHLLHGINAGPYHLFNVVLMGVTALAVYALLRTPTLAVHPAVALFGAALFAMHPMASSCVYPICSGRETLMPALFIIGAVWAFLRPGRRWYMLAMMLLAVSLLCKEQSVIVPGLFVLADFLGLSADAPGRSVGRWGLRYLPVVVVLLLYLTLRWMLFGGGGEHPLDVLDHPAGPLLALAYMLQTTFAPFHQLVYEPRVEVWMSARRELVSLGMIILLAVAVYRQWPDLRAVVLFWLGWILLTLLPTANLLRQEARFAERYGLLALLGVIGIAAALVAPAWSRPEARRWLAGAAAVLLVACATITVNRGVYYKNESAFLGQWVRSDPRSPQAHFALGECCRRDDKLDEAIDHFRQALRIHPNVTNVHNNLGSALYAQGKFDEAMNHYHRALTAAPNNAKAHINLAVALAEQGKTAASMEHLTKALEFEPDSVEAHSNLGSILAKQQQYDQALDHLSRAVQLKPGHLQARFNLGLLLEKRGDWQGAVEQYLQALRVQQEQPDASNKLAPRELSEGNAQGAAELLRVALQGVALQGASDPAETHYNLGVILLKQGKWQKATSYFAKAVRIRPEYAEAHNNLGNLLAKQGRLQEALLHLHEAARIKPDYAEAIGNSGIILALQGRSKEAITWFRRALHIRPGWPDMTRRLAWVLATDGDPQVRNGPEAVKLARQLAQSTGGRDPMVLYTLAVAYAEAGRPDKAADNARQAIRLATNARNMKLAAQIRAWLQRHQARETQSH